MAVAYTADTDAAPTTASSFTYLNFAVSGTNPVILVCTALLSTTTTNYSVSDVSVSAGLSGTPVLVKEVQNPNGPTVGTYAAIWAIVAPSGTGTITVTLSGSTPYQSNAILLAGADQTTPCPAADGVIASGNTPNPLVLTPTNLTANDAAVGAGGNGGGGDGPVFQQTETFNSNTTLVNMAAGYHLGTGSVSVNWLTPDAGDAMVAVRVVAATVAVNDELAPGRRMISEPL